LKILITGPPGVGKTTIIKRIASALGRRAGGFYTEEIRESGIRKGFEIETLDGKKGILASVDIKSAFKVGKYKVNIEDIERICVKTIEDAVDSRDFVIIDEIGKMELASSRFKEAVKYAFESSKTVVATIKETGDSFTNAIKRSSNLKIFEVNQRNRDNISEEILKEVVE
jgi:nucleoside-triphosphatase